MFIGLIFFVSVALNGIQFQKNFDRCQAVDFKESKCELHKSNFEKYSEKK